MQVTETRADQFQREFKVVVPAADLDAKVNARLSELKDRANIKGFRPGKVPVAHLRRVYGRGTMMEVIEATVNEATAQIVTDHGFKLATDPKVTLPTEQGEVEQLLTGKTDLSYSVALEIVPSFPLANFKNLKLEKLTAEVSDADIDAMLQRIGEQNRPYKAKSEGSVAETGDRVQITQVGTIHGQPFEGGSGDATVIAGTGAFGTQLLGMAVGESRTVRVSFPEQHANRDLAGKPAEFFVTANAIEVPVDVTIDDAFAASLGLESLAKLREATKDSIAQEYAAVSRRRLKRALLDQLDAAHQFDPPPSLVEDEFQQVWNTILSDLQKQNRTFEDEGTTEEAAREDYRKIAARRVRLGLVLAEIGEKNNIKVNDEEVSRAIVEQARQFPGQQDQVFDYYRKNPTALAGLRAPIFEEKVVDFLVELADVTEKKVSRDELYSEEAETQATEPAAGG